MFLFPVCREIFGAELTKLKHNPDILKTVGLYDRPIRKGNTDTRPAAEGIWMTVMNTNINNNNKNNTVYLVTSAAGFMGGIVVRKLLERV